MPGLWDAHVHFAYMEDLAPSMFDLFLGYGITSVRDTGGKMDFVKMWKDKIREEELVKNVNARKSLSDTAVIELLHAYL